VTTEAAGKPGLDEFLRRLAANCGLASDAVAACLTDPEGEYCVYPLRKGTKVRWIEAPGTNLKSIQRTLLDDTLYTLRATEHAHGFVPGRSIVTNARLHVGRQWVVTLDIKDFFPSITSRQVRAAIDGLGSEPEVLSALTRLLSRHGRLPQGAPTSPHVANLVAAEIDHRLAGMVTSRGWIYTRYADDLTFSGDSAPLGLVDEVEALLREHGFRVARGKTHVTGRDQRQMVTGLVVNDRVRLPKPQRRRLRAMLHQAEIRGDAAALDPVLQGHLAFARFVSRDVHQWETEQLLALANLHEPAGNAPSPVVAGS
jgi:RNA-directed DNA polymerase